MKRFNYYGTKYTVQVSEEPSPFVGLDRWELLKDGALESYCDMIPGASIWVACDRFGMADSWEVCSVCDAKPKTYADDHGRIVWHGCLCGLTEVQS